MRAVDTDVVIRYLTGDDPVQAKQAAALIEQEPIFVSRTVVLEVEWVLRGVYRLPVERIIAALRDFAGIPGVLIEDAPLVAKAMEWTENGMDFADALHLAAAGECRGFLTFDQWLVRAGTRIGGIPVTTP